MSCIMFLNVSIKKMYKYIKQFAKYVCNNFAYLRFTRDDLNSSVTK